MKVPTVEEAHKIVSDADLGVGCVVDEKELMLARFVFENSPVRSPELFRQYLQQIVDAAAAEQIIKQAGTVDQFVVKEISNHTYAVDHINATVTNGLNEINKELSNILAMAMLSAAFTCFILGVILYKIS